MDTIVIKANKIMNTKKNDTLIIIPVFNEEKNIGKVLDVLSKKHKDADILVVNDGSSDNSKKEIKKKGFFLLNHPFNLGIGASLETGCQFALEKGYAYIIRMDGDGQHNSYHINNLVEPLRKDKADIIVGSRFLEYSEYRSSNFRIIGIKIISLFLNLLTGKKVTDPTSGFCAMNRKAFKFFSNNFSEDYPEPEILLYHREFRIKEIPIEINKRRYGFSSITPFKSLYYMVKVLFSLFIHIFRKERR